MSYIHLPEELEGLRVEEGVTWTGHPYHRYGHFLGHLIHVCDGIFHAHYTGRYPWPHLTFVYLPGAEVTLDVTLRSDGHMYPSHFIMHFLVKARVYLG